MSEQKLAAELRTDFGKGAARQARRANKIPAVIYGHGADPIHVLLPAKATTLAVRHANAKSVTITLAGLVHAAAPQVEALFEPPAGAVATGQESCRSS